MKRILTIPLCLLLAQAVLIPTSSAAVLTNFDNINLLTFGSQGGATLATGDFYPAAGNELQFTTGTGGFLNYAAAFTGRSDAAVGLILSNTSLIFNYYALSGEMPQAARLRIVINTDSWLNAGGNYRAFNFVDLPASTDSNGLFTFDYSANTDFTNALTNYQSGGGTYFGIGFDNGGFPTISTPVKFGIGEIQAVPEPSAVGCLLVGATLSLLARSSRYSRVAFA